MTKASAIIMPGMMPAIRSLAIEMPARLPSSTARLRPGATGTVTWGEREAPENLRVWAEPVGTVGLVKIGVIDLPVFYLDFNGRAQNLPDYRSSTRDVKRLIGELKEEGVDLNKNVMKKIKKALAN